MKCVYKIINTVTNKCYIGSTKNFKKRMLDHKSGLKRGRHYNINLQTAWDKYGEKAFAFTSIEECENYREREDYYLNKADIKNDTYNIAESSKRGWNPKNHPNGEEILKNKVDKQIATMKALTKEERSIKFGKFGKDNYVYKGTEVTDCINCGTETYYNGFKCKNCYLKEGSEYEEGITQFEKQLIKRARSRNDLYTGEFIHPKSKTVIIDGIEYTSMLKASEILNIPYNTLARRIRSKNFTNYSFKNTKDIKPDKYEYKSIA